MYSLARLLLNIREQLIPMGPEILLDLMVVLIASGAAWDVIMLSCVMVP